MVQWREKQLEYTFRRALMREYVDFRPIFYMASWFFRRASLKQWVHHAWGLERLA